MILYTVDKLRIYETRSDQPNSDWTGKAEFIVDETNPENAELLTKIRQLAPCFDYVTDGKGNLIDVKENDVVLPEPEYPEPSEPVEDANYDDLAKAIQEGVNEV